MSERSERAHQPMEGQPGFRGQRRGMGVGPQMGAGPGMRLAPGMEAMPCPTCGQMGPMPYPTFGPMAPTPGYGPGGYPTPRPYMAPTRMSDEDVKAQIQQMFDSTPGLAGSDIKIEVKQGVVTLSGEVDSPMIKRQAEAMVYPLPAVRDVVDNLSIARG